MRQPRFGYRKLEAAISAPRARRYLQATADPTTGQVDPGAAVRLYEHNARLSRAAWGSIADVEIVVRNLVASAIAAHHDAQPQDPQRPKPLHRWYDGPSWFRPGEEWWTQETTRNLTSAMGKAHDPGPIGAPRPGEGKVVAQLTLGFWRFLLVARYEHSLWNPAIRAQFGALSHLSGSDSRKEVYRRVEALNLLRNRVAHHEPIFTPFRAQGQRLDPSQVLAEAIEMVSWSNPDAAAWIADRDQFGRLWERGSDSRLMHSLRPVGQRLSTRLATAIGPFG